MIDWSRPETWSLLGLMGVAIYSLIRGVVIPGITHDRILSAVKDSYEQQLTALREENKLWKEIALRGVQLSERSVEVIKQVKK